MEIERVQRLRLKQLFINVYRTSENALTEKEDESEEEPAEIEELEAEEEEEEDAPLEQEEEHARRSRRILKFQ
jgi:hypothetical protein